jgi:hypothetical protein
MMAGRASLPPFLFEIAAFGAYVARMLSAAAH